jgi:putative phosphoribosyl transferase
LVDKKKKDQAIIENRQIRIDTDGVKLQGSLSVPDQALGVVLVIHGGSERQNPRNRFIAGEIQAAGMATVLLDLLTPEEEEVDTHTRHLRFDINMLARRTMAVIDWITDQSFSNNLKVGLFGASTSAAAALITAAERPNQVGAVVSGGGRPDLAANALSRVQAPTLLIVGGLDYPVIELNELALANLHPRPMKEMEIVPGATHLFEEHGALESVARLATDWFQRFLPPSWQE